MTTATSLSLSLRPASTVVQISTTTAYSYITSYAPQTTVYAPPSTITVTVSNRGAATSSAAPSFAFTTRDFCPAIDDQDIASSNGTPYTMHCASDTNIGSFADARAGYGYGDCLDACDRTPRCVAFTYDQVGLVQANAGSTIVGVKKVVSAPSSAAASSSSVAPPLQTAPVQEDYSCPENDRQRVIDNYGGVYTLACSSDTSGGGAFAGDSPDFNGCFEKCDSTLNCVGFTYDGNNCYLKTGAANSISFVPAASNFVGAIRNMPSDGNLYSHLDCYAASSEHEHHDDHCARTSCQHCNNYCTSTSSKYCDGDGDTNYWLPNNDTSGKLTVKEKTPNFRQLFPKSTTAAPTVALSSPTTIISSAANHDDEIVARVVPFAISICGFSSNNLTISTNGVLGFGITSSYQPAALPQYTALSPTGYAVIPFWADLYIAQGTSQGIYYQVDGTAGSRIMTFEYYATYYNKTANYYHFQILFYENNPNSFTFKYLNVTDNGVNAVVGYQCQPNSKFKQYSAKQAIITGGLQVDYSYSADTFTSGRVPSRVAMIGPMIDFVNRIVDNVSSSWRAATSWMRDKPSSTPSNEVYAPKPSVTFEANVEDSINRRWAGGYGRRENSSTLA
ncbi:hypothetical protein D6C78_07389 [Aureobasidium pullulans]|uniref:Apple domain-containing protein n=1 Tax=Aureobasidium pullulans TaxID=5580 RepID=A0A4T0BMW4_AURPU|nr:hypothetical protein D6C78_07389 [Aureobasidium pullulans]